MLYFIFGLENYQIQTKLESLQKQFFSQRTLKKIYFHDEDLDDFENEFFVDSLFGPKEKEVFWVKNPTFFDWAEKSYLPQQQRLLKLMERLIKDGIDVIFTCHLATDRYLSSIRRRFKNHFVVANLKEKIMWIELLKPLSQREVDVHISQIAERFGSEIEFRAKKELRERFYRDITMIQAEIEKLSLVHKKIKAIDVEFSGDLWKWPPDTTLFRRCFNIMRDFKGFFITTQGLLYNGTPEITLLAQINYVFRMILMVDWLWKDGMSVKEIGEYLGIQPFKICGARPRCQKGCSQCSLRYTGVEDSIKFLEESSYQPAVIALKLAAQFDEASKNERIGVTLAFDIFIIKLERKLKASRWS